MFSHVDVLARKATLFNNHKEINKLQFLEQTTKEPQLIPKYLCTISFHVTMTDPIFTYYIDLNMRSPSFSPSLCSDYVYYCVCLCGCMCMCKSTGLYEINFYQFISTVSNNIWMWKLTKKIYFLLTRKDSAKNLYTARWCNAIWQW